MEEEKTIEKARTEIYEMLLLLSEEEISWLRSFIYDYYFNK